MSAYDVGEFLLVAAAIYFAMGAILIAFAKPIYVKVQQSDAVPWYWKGAFAKAVISYYNVKTLGLDAGWNHWGYCLGFNAAVAGTVSFLVVTGIALILAALAIIASVIVLVLLVWIIGGVMSS